MSQSKCSNRTWDWSGLEDGDLVDIPLSDFVFTPQSTSNGPADPANDMRSALSSSSSSPPPPTRKLSTATIKPAHANTNVRAMGKQEIFDLATPSSPPPTAASIVRKPATLKRQTPKQDAGRAIKRPRKDARPPPPPIQGILQKFGSRLGRDNSTCTKFVRFESSNSPVAQRPSGQPGQRTQTPVNTRAAEHEWPFQFEGANPDAKPQASSLEAPSRDSHFPGHHPAAPFIIDSESDPESSESGTKTLHRPRSATADSFPMPPSSKEKEEEKRKQLDQSERMRREAMTKKGTTHRPSSPFGSYGSLPGLADDGIKASSQLPGGKSGTDSEHRNLEQSFRTPPRPGDVSDMVLSDSSGSDLSSPPPKDSSLNKLDKGMNGTMLADSTLEQPKPVSNPEQVAKALVKSARKAEERLQQELRQSLSASQKQQEQLTKRDQKIREDKSRRDREANLQREKAAQIERQRATQVLEQQRLARVAAAERTRRQTILQEAAKKSQLERERLNALRKAEREEERAALEDKQKQLREERAQKHCKRNELNSLAEEDEEEGGDDGLLILDEAPGAGKSTRQILELAAGQTSRPFSLNSASGVEALTSLNNSADRPEAGDIRKLTKTIQPEDVRILRLRNRSNESWHTIATKWPALTGKTRSGEWLRMRYNTTTKMLEQANISTQLVERLTEGDEDAKREVDRLLSIFPEVRPVNAGKILPEDAYLLRWRDEGLAWPTVTARFQQLTRKPRIEKTIRKRHSVAKKAFDDAKIPASLVRDLTDGYEDAERQVGSLLSGGQEHIPQELPRSQPWDVQSRTTNAGRRAKIEADDAHLLYWRDMGDDWLSISSKFLEITGKARTPHTLQIRYNVVKETLEEAGIGSSTLRNEDDAARRVGQLLTRSPDHMSQAEIDSAKINSRDARLVRMRDTDATWNSISSRFKASDLPSSIPQLQERYRVVKTNIDNAGLDDDELELLAEEDEVAQYQVDQKLERLRNAAVPGKCMSSASNASNRRDSAVQEPIFIPSSSPGVQIIQPTRAPQASSTASVRPTTGGKTINAAMMMKLIEDNAKVWQEAVDEATQECSFESCTEFDPEDPSDHVYYVFQVRRRDISTQEESQNGSCLSTIPFHDTGPIFESVHEANQYASVDILQTYPSRPVLTQPGSRWTLAQETLDHGRVSYTLTNEQLGTCEIVVEARLRTTREAISPKTKEHWIPKIQYAVFQKTTQLLLAPPQPQPEGLDDLFDEAPVPEMSAARLETRESHVDDRITYEAMIANRWAIEYFVKITTPQMRNLDQRDVEMERRREEFEAKIANGEEEMLFREKAVDDDGVEIEVWVMERIV